MGILLDVIGRTVATTAFANLLGCAMLVATAWIVAWFKAPPWRKPPSRRPEPAAPEGRATAAPLNPATQPGASRVGASA
jgi:hypothetical protein